MSTGSVGNSSFASPSSEAYTSPPLTIILTVTFLVFFFVGFFSLYFCRCFLENLSQTRYPRRSPSGTPTGLETGTLGLHPSIIEKFPIFTYSSVKDLRKEKYGLECAVCLCEFMDADILRLLTPCCHVYHQECIDLWLDAHKTCPVCRRRLDAPEKSPEKVGHVIGNTPMHDIIEDEPLEDSVRISIREEDNGEGEDEDEDERRVRCEGDEEDMDMEMDKQSEREKNIEKFSRSHSTGHSIVRNSGAEDRYTLRLPEHLQAKLMRRHNWAKSCTTFGEYKSRVSAGNGGFAEVTSEPGKDA